MAGSNDTATFNINLQGNASDAAKTAAASMEELRARIAAGQGALKEMSANLRNLRGSTDEVKAAKNQLKAKLDAERAAISGATLQMIKHGGVTDKVAAETKRLAAAKAAWIAKTDAANKAQAEANSGMAAFAGGLAAVATAVLAVVAATAAAGVGLAKFVLHSADAARSAGLLRQAAMGGNALWGQNFGEQVDALAQKVPTSRAEIDKLGMSLAKSNIGGKTWVDTLNAVTQASAALGDDAGSKLKEFITRGQQFQRFQINPQEMIGTGVTFNEVAEQLASSMKIGVDKAKAALFEGRVKLGDGAAAMRAAVEKKFGGINLRQMISLENLSKKLGEAFDSLTKNVNLEPLLKGLKEMAGIFDLSTVSGQALKQIVEVFSKELVGAFAGTTPLAKKFVYGLILGAQELVIGYLQVRNSLRKTFGDTDILKNVDVLKLSLNVGKAAALSIAAAFVLVGAAVAAAVAPFAAIYAGVSAVQDAIASLTEKLIKIDWNELGMNLVRGLVKGLKAGAEGILKTSVIGLADTVKNAFTGEMKIKSPSKVSEEWGGNIGEGAAIGVEGKSGRVDGAMRNLVSPPGGGGAGGGGGLVVNVGGIVVHASGNAQEIAAAVTNPSVLEQITKAIVDAVQGGGIPVPT